MDWLYQNELNRCLLCEDAPCSNACPNNQKPDIRIRFLYFNNRYNATHAVEKNLEIFKKLKEKHPSKIIIASIWDKMKKNGKNLHINVIKLAEMLLN